MKMQILSVNQQLKIVSQVRVVERRMMYSRTQYSNGSIVWSALSLIGIEDQYGDGPLEAKYQKLIKALIKPNIHLKGRFLVRFSKKYMRNSWAENDFMPARIEPYTGPTSPHLKRLYVEWDSGMRCVVIPEHLEVKLLI